MSDESVKKSMAGPSIVDMGNSSSAVRSAAPQGHTSYGTSVVALSATGRLRYLTERSILNREGEAMSLFAPRRLGRSIRGRGALHRRIQPIVTSSFGQRTAPASTAS